MRVLSYEFSPLFEDFLRRRILAMGAKVHFHPMSELPEEFSGEVAFCWRGTDGLHVYLNTRLEARVAEVKTAHELAHEVLVREGYPGTLPLDSGDAQTQILASRLSSSVLNALVNHRIGEFGFDLDAYDEMGIRALVRNTPKNPDLESMTQWENLVYNGLVYLDNYLDKMINPRVMPELEAQAAFLKTIPGQWDLVEKLVAVVEVSGIESPEQCLRAMIQLRDVLGAKGRVMVVDVRSGIYY